MANEKKIAKNQKMLLFRLGEALKLEDQLSKESDTKKQIKLQKKINYNNEMTIFYCKHIGQDGGNLKNVWNDMTERQQQIIQELFPYGVESDNLAQQEKG